MNQQPPKSELDIIIPPEIKDDEFYAAIQRIAREEDIKTVLEIGSSSGSGSTEAFVSGLRENQNQPTLFCLEVSRTRFAELQKRYADYPFVKCYNLSSVSLEQFPDEKEVVDFYSNNRTNLNHYPLERIIGWLRQDIEYVKRSGVSDSGIKKIKQSNNIDVFDVVLIDGSEFTGTAELNEVYGAKFILLDDINTFNNYHSYERLFSDTNYVIYSDNSYIRNGYCIFKKIDNKGVFFFKTEIAEQVLVRKILQEGMTAFDVGANKGDYSILFSQMVTKKGKVYSFEPTSSTFKQLKERIAKIEDYNHIEIFQKAVYSENTIIEINEFPENYSAWNSIGKPQMPDPMRINEYIPTFKTENVEAIALDSFCHGNNINKIDYLKIDVEGAESNVLQGCRELLKTKAIRFIQFEISQKMLEGLNKTAREIFDVLLANDYECHCITNTGEIGEQVRDSRSFYENYIAFPTIPIHFFTIVLNGEPFIRYHIQVFKQLPFKWHWHIIEGVADLKHDTAWSLATGGQITSQMHRDGQSNDGTTEYIDSLAQLYPENVTVYRKPKGVFWEGKLEMVNAPMSNINEECLLWQVDVDELWKVSQIEAARKMFIMQADRTAAFYWCWFFVGENLVITTRDCYSATRGLWLRTWRFKPGYFWAAHEPPRLVEGLPDGKGINIAAVKPFWQEETENQGLVFQHFAYVTPQQLKFKEEYYGYKNALAEWTELQEQTEFPVLLRQFFGWVKDDTMVDKSNTLDMINLAQREPISGEWQFIKPKALPVADDNLKKISPTILVDGACFQLAQTEVAPLLTACFQEWVATGFAHYIIVLDRAQTAPKIPGLRYRAVPPYDENNAEGDCLLLQQVCDEEGADLFISTFNTTPTTTKSVFLAYRQVAGEAMLYVEDNDGDELANALCDVQNPDVRQALATTISSALLDATLVPLKLKEINAIVFPDWAVNEESLALDLERAIKALATHPDRSRMTLLIDASNLVCEEDANLILSSITMNLLMEEDLDLSLGPEISLVYQLGDMQWQALLPRIKARIVLEDENKQAIVQASAENIRLWKIDKLNID